MSARRFFPERVAEASTCTRGEILKFGRPTDADRRQIGAQISRKFLSKPFEGHLIPRKLANMVATDYLKTTKPLNTQAPPAGRLQRLGFIPVYSSIAYGYAASAYEAAKSYVPAGIKPRVESAEKLYSKNVQPIVAKFTDGGQEILLVLDKRVRFSEKKYLELVVTRDRSALSLEVDGRIFQVKFSTEFRSSCRTKSHILRFQA